MRLRQRAPLTAQVVHIHTRMDLDAFPSLTVSFIQVGLDEAHNIADRPLTRVTACQGDHLGRETAWWIDVLALIVEEAYGLVDSVIEDLRADIEAGRIMRGDHSQPPLRGEDLDWREAFLDRFRREELGRLERAR
jgi:hypothetical protein